MGKEMSQFQQLQQLSNTLKTLVLAAWRGSRKPCLPIPFSRSCLLYKRDSVGEAGADTTVTGLKPPSFARVHRCHQRQDCIAKSL